MNRLFLILVCGAVIFSGQGLLVNARAEDQRAVVVSGAWVREVPPSMPQTAAFMRISNSTDKDISVTSVSSDTAQTLEMHTMERVDGVMKMMQVSSILIPAQGSVELKPGGLHIMLFGLKRPLKEGETMTLQLGLNNGISVSVPAKVQAPGMAEAATSHHHH